MSQTSQYISRKFSTLIRRVTDMVTINGRTYNGTRIVVNNGRVTIDGVEVKDHGAKNGILRVEVTGNLCELQSDASVSCENVLGDVRAAGSVNCDDVSGNVAAGGSVNADSVGGNIMAGGSVNI